MAFVAGLVLLIVGLASSGRQPASAAGGRGYASVPPAGPPAGWYPDPHDPGRRRYYDGASWTEHTA